MFLLAGFNPRGRTVLWAKAQCGPGAPRWTRLYRFQSGDFAWIGRRLGWARYGPGHIYDVIGIEWWKLQRSIPYLERASGLWQRPRGYTAEVKHG